VEEQLEARRSRQPGDPWQSELFYFIRLVKLHPDMARKTARQAMRAVERVMGRWQHAGKLIPGFTMTDWKYWLSVDQEDAQTEFLQAWDRVRVLPGHSPLENALERAEREPLELLPELQERRTDGYRDFVSIAGWLQVGVGDRNILLPVEELAGPLRVKPMTISRWRTWAIEDGYLQAVKPYERPGKGKGKATEFRFDVRKWDCLLKLAPWAKQK
jgi:hypothetical protein